MNIYIGFAFTDGPITNLMKRGFSLERSELTENLGYHTATAYFSNGGGFQIRKILDEQKYTYSQSVEKFEPQSMEIQSSVLIPTHLNSVVRLRRHLVEDLVAPGPLRLYLKVRKQFNLWALHLECEDIQTFIHVAEPDQIFELEGKKTALLHLGPNCFDLVVTNIGDSSL